jgi:solute carrier family 13 (sodium-dependent dicarboxylate transporter), member 2/3/5
MIFYSNMFEVKSNYMLFTKYLKLLSGPIAFLVLYKCITIPELPNEAKAVLAGTVWIALWWILEAIPIAATALLPIVIFPLTDAMTIQDTTSAYGHYFVFLYLGGFFIAIAIEKWNLHRRIALNILRVLGTKSDYIVLGFMLATAFLSMWISNTATAVMLLPVGMALILQMKDNPNTIVDEKDYFGKSIMLGIAYGASIGGISTLIGTPPNLVLAGVIKSTYNSEISFAEWFILAFPLSLLLLFSCWYYLTKIQFNIGNQSLKGGKSEIEKQIKLLGTLSKEEKRVAIVFSITAICWIMRSFVLNIYFPKLDDTIIAMIGGLSLFLISSSKDSENLLNWEDAKKIPWGVILLFGGGMALAAAFETSGLAQWIGANFTAFNGYSTFFLLVVIVLSVNFLTEVTSNLATTAMLLPVLVTVSEAANVHPYFIMIGATIAASCAFMLPVATPPNAVVFGSGLITIREMVKAGFWMNIISVILISLYLYFVLPLVFDLKI